MEWKDGFSARYYATIVDPNTWRDRDRFEITDGSIKRSLDNLIESADITCVKYSETSEQWIRIWLDAKQKGDSSHIPLFTGLATSPSRVINGSLETNTLQCYSVLKPADDVLLPRGWYAPAGSDASTLIRQLLTVTHAPITTPDTKVTLTTAIIAESGETNLTMVWAILNSVNWTVKIGGNGSITIAPYDSSTIISSFDYLKNDVLEPSIQVSYDWYSCPNIFRAVIDNDYAVAIDDDPNSVFSTVNRGREVWFEETSVTLNDKETSAEYARRRLKELQNIATTISYDRRFDPDVVPGNLIRLNYPKQNLTGSYFVTSQTITLGYNCKTSEEVCIYGN